jgi:2-dehydro-3-deoxygalactonokinase
MNGADWIAVDWGTSHLRAWAMKGADILDHAHSDDGMGGLTRDRFETVLLALIGHWLPPDRPITIIACGMVGSRQGWVEAPYRKVPCLPLAGPLVAAPTRDLRLSVHVTPGLRQDKPADVMRGEETQIAGFLALNPNWDGVICLPGTHCKWVHVSAGEVVSFQTFLTGEMFALLSEHSVLRHSVAGWDDAGFSEGVAQGLDRPDRLLARLFSLRAEGLLHGLDAGVARARLSGLLIGAELAAAKPYWLGQRVALVGDAGLSAAYATALQTLAVPVQMANATDVTLAGLNAARALIPQNTERKCVN